MSLGDYEHKFRVGVLVTVRSRSGAPSPSDEPWDAVFYARDGVEFMVESVEHVDTENLLPQEVRRTLEEATEQVITEEDDDG